MITTTGTTFIAGREKMDTLEDDSGFLPLAPKLAVEVVSRKDRFADVEMKAINWLNSGTRLILILEPESKTVHAYRSRSKITILDSTDLLDATDAVRGWKVQVSEFFS